MFVQIGKKAFLLIWLWLGINMESNAQLKANFTIPPPGTGCTYLSESFVNTTSGASASVTYTWRLGNGNTSKVKNASAIYVSAKTYDITLIDSDGNKVDSITKSITIFNGPTANFSVAKTAGCAPLLINFTDYSSSATAPITGWLWDFGDGVTDTGRNLSSHSYANTGKYTMSLFLTDKHGCQGSYHFGSQIVVESPPTVDFTSSSSGGCYAPQSINFTSKVTSSFGGLNYTWNFGDGSTPSANQNPGHTYTTTGSFNVSLTATDSTGCTSTTSKPGFIFIGTPKADFQFSPSNGCAPLNVSFSDNSTGIDSGTKFFWDFGDGTTSTGAFPAPHAYAVGKYTVKEIVTNPSGCGDTVVKANVIYVTQPFTPSFTADTILCQAPIEATLINTSGANTHVLFWNYGDSTTPSSSNTHFYTVPPPLGSKSRGSPFTVTLVVEDNNQCIEQITKSRYIYAEATEVDLNLGNTSGCVPLTVPISDFIQTIDPIKRYTWQFGDTPGDSSNVQNPGSFTYRDTGKFTITVSVVTNRGCRATNSDSIKVGDIPPVSFTGGPYSGCLNSLRHEVFTSTSNNDPSNPIKAEQYNWSFSDGKTFQTPGVIWDARGSTMDDKPGTYNVQLITSNHGCTDTLIKKQIIKITGPWAQFAVAQNDPCHLGIVTFTDKSLDNNRVEYYFGDGDSSAQRNVVHIYQPGLYHPSQIVYNDTSGCSDTFKISNGILVNPPWTITFSDSPSTGCIPFTTSFVFSSNDSSSNLVDFGDGTTLKIKTDVQQPNDTGRNFTHVYYTKGIDTVKVKSINLYNQCVQNMVLSPPISVSGPTAKFVIDRFSGCIPLKVGMIDLSGKDSSAIGKFYQMGNGDIVQDNKDTVYYTYTSPPPDQSAGYTIVQVVKEPGCSNYFYQPIYPTQPVPQFTIDSDITCTSTLYLFLPDDDSTQGVPPFKHVWEFGDGSPVSTQDNPVHVYKKSGTYKVTLKMTDIYGCSDTVSQFVKYYKAISKANFTINSDTSSCPPFDVKFTNISTFAYGGIDSFEWNFGDGSSPVYIGSPSKVYYLPGTYTVSLKITDSLGCQDSITKKGLISIKGATGSYTISPKRGCMPLTVQFTATSKNASKFTWDPGDGSSTVFGSSIIHTYSLPQAYIPYLLISDSFGCSYPLRQNDTVIVDPLPIPDFSYLSICSGLPTYFYDSSQAVSGTLVSWDWDFGDGVTATTQNPVHNYKKNGYYGLTLTVKTSLGCSATLKRTIKIGGVTAGFKAPAVTCVGSMVQFTDTSKSDTAIKSRLWLFGDGDSSTLTNPTHTYLKKGLYTLSLFVTSYKGCSDTLVRQNALVVGDTFPPLPITLYRVTVVSDTSVKLEYSKYADVDFSKYVIFMKDLNGNFITIDSLTGVNDTVVTISHLKTLINVYCFEVQSGNICGHYSPKSGEHCTINVTAKPGIDKAVITWTPYIGWNVLNYQIFRKSYYSNSFLPIGIVPGDTLDYSDTDIVCYKPVTYEIEAFEKGGFGQTSWSDTSTTLPIHVPRLPMPQLIHATVPDNHNILVEWNDIPNLKIRRWIVEKSFDGLKYNILDSPFTRNILSVTDSKTDVGNNSYYYRLGLMDSCGDVSPYGNIAKTILLRVDTTPNVRPLLYWTGYKSWPEGVQYYEIDIKDANGNFNMLARTSSGSDTTYIDNITDLNSLPDYCYRVIAHRNGPATNPDENLAITSISNDGCVHVSSRVFVPNAFTPNGDGLNDSLVIKGLFINQFHIRIYDRWGTKVFESNSLKDSWDGTFKGGKPVTDVYKYLINVKGTDGNLYYFKGTITVLQ